MAKKRFEQNQSDMRSINNANIGRRGKKKRRRSSYARITLVLTVLAVAAVGVVLSLTVFFKIKNVDVSGNTEIYTPKQIISAGKIEFDSNLIRLSSKAVSNRIETALPFIEDARVIKKLPTTVELNITAATSAGFVKKGSSYVVVSTRGKVLEIAKKQPEKLPEIAGVKLEKVSVADVLSDDNKVFSSIQSIYEKLGAALARDITEIDVTDNLNLSFTYRDRIDVRLGSETELAEKLKFVAILLADGEKIDDDDMGVVYASNPKRVSFLRKGSYSEYIAEQEKLKEQEDKLNAEQEALQNGQGQADKNKENSSNVESQSTNT